ncbi:MAG: carbohydrate ABC transporter permease [Actinomycetota bacterium]|nr:carbohydrate ABC transporter permease [Actinomycetota bacterium]
MKKTFIWLFLFAFILFSILPFIIVIFTSLKTNQEMYANVLAPPSSFYLDNYLFVLSEAKFYLNFLNSLYISIPVVISISVLSTLAGYAFSKINFWKKNILFFIILIGLMLPLPSIIIPIYLNLAKLGFLNTRIGVILTQIGIDLPFAIFFMRSFFNDVPNEIIESARIDGANDLQIIMKVMVPLSKSSLGALSLILFMWSWQSYIVPLVIITDNNLRPLTVALTDFVGRYITAYTYIAAASVLIFLPITILFIITQRRFIEGITAGYGK